MNAPVRPYHEVYDEVADLRAVLEVRDREMRSLTRHLKASESARRREARALATSPENLIGVRFVDREGVFWTPISVLVTGRGLATVTLQGLPGTREVGLSAFRGRAPLLTPAA